MAEMPKIYLKKLYLSGQHAILHHIPASIFEKKLPQVLQPPEYVVVHISGHAFLSTFLSTLACGKVS